MKATKNNVIIKPEIPKKIGSIILPSHLDTVASSQSGVVLSCGAECSRVKEGDTVLFRKFQGSVEGSKLFFCDETNCYLLKVPETELLAYIR